MLKFSSQLLCALLGACVGCSSAAAQPESVVAQDASVSRVDGIFEQYLVSPRGDVDGILLKDGTVARFAPHVFVASSEARLTAGDKVHLEGDLVVRPAGRVVEHARVTKGATAVALGEQTGTPPPLPPPGPPGIGEDALVQLGASGSIARLLSGPQGNIDCLVLTDGTTVRVGRRAHLDRLALKPGDQITVTGRGGSYPHGKALQLETITLPGGTTRTLERPQAERAPGNREGVVSRLLINPHGDLDGVLLGTNDVVRFRPSNRSSLPLGTNLRATGVASAHALEADTIRLASGQTMRLERAEKRAPTALGQVEDESIIERVVPNLDGEAEMLILRDGAIVRVPPEVRDEAAQALAAGNAVHAKGEGGVYDGIKALRATSLMVNGRQYDADPRPAPLPPPGPPLIP